MFNTIIQVGRKEVLHKPALFIASHDEGESIINNPPNTQLLNAAKISGKTRKKPDVGIFNAVTSNTWENVFEINNKSSNLSSLAFRLGHYWITLQSNDYFDLMEYGALG